jgi:hypothetical protein
MARFVPTRQDKARPVPTPATRRQTLFAGVVARRAPGGGPPSLAWECPNHDRRCSPSVAPRTPARAALQRLLLGHVAAQAVYAAAKLGLADLLAEGPSPLARLAAAVEADRDALGRLLRALADLGLIEEPAPGTLP